MRLSNYGIQILINLISLHLVYAKMIKKDTQCSLKSKKYISYSTLDQEILNESLIIKNFNDFDELNFNCSGITVKTYVLFFVPNNEILLDNTFSFNSLLYSIKFLERKLIGLFRLKGFNYDRYKNIYKYLEAQEVSVQFSRFEFYFNERLVDESLCVLSNFNNTKVEFFGTIKVLMMDSNIYYSKNTCPFVFMNTKLIRLTLNQISNSLILKNQFGFIDVNQTSDFDLNNQDFYYLNVGFAYETLSSTILNKYAFKFLKRLVVCGIVYDIETDLLKNFKRLNFFSINLQNMKQLLENNNKWMKYLNSHVNINMSDINEVNRNLDKLLIFEIVQKNGNLGSYTAFNKAYMYPEEDFCLFKDVPHEK